MRLIKHFKSFLLGCSFAYYLKELDYLLIKKKYELSLSP